jgi:hypothetical protein
MKLAIGLWGSMSRPNNDFNAGFFNNSELGYWTKVNGDGPDTLRITRVDGDYLEGEMITKSYRVLRKDYVPQWKKTNN